MKKILIIITITVICIFAVGCTKNNGGEPETSAVETTAVAETAGETAADKTAVPVKKVTLPRDEYIASFKKLVLNDGFEITSGDGSVKFGGSEFAYWNITDSIGSAQENDGETLFMYVFDGQEWILDMERPVSEIADADYFLENQIIGMIFCGDYADMEEIGEETVAGRACKSYKDEIKYMGASVKCTLCIDSEYGFCLSVTSEEGLRILTAESVKIGDDVEVPELPGEDDGEIWKENRFTAVLPKPEFGILTSAEATADGHGFHVFVNVANEANVNAYVQTLLDAGFTGEKTLENEGMDIRFNGQTAGYTVELFYTNGVVTIDLADIIE